MAFYLLTTVDKTEDGWSDNWTNTSNYAAGEAYTQMIVRAISEKAARKLAYKYAGDEQGHAWLHSSTTCQKLHPRSWPIVFRGHTAYAERKRWT